jgi:hypothetical protein
MERGNKRGEVLLGKDVVILAGFFDPKSRDCASENLTHSNKQCKIPVCPDNVKTVA